MAKKNEPEAEAKTSKVATADKGSNPSPVNFIQETKEELNKVVWPSRPQLISESAAVIFMVSLSAALIYLVDGLFKWLAERIFLGG
ncbi:preprotein translocase subunit SecE [Merismopedia glauca CCAP 1448/3]|uniref:Protein translocase subunit SecE n=1 Tax=Merismopedia glauca CCAP 1448/3 TaxID=1296344 RepID=A0A2T1C8C8_9CYAN|nr:preprotein translocase subunit SecE [Merismopedia glauca CCAP 1448/3]